MEHADANLVLKKVGAPVEYLGAILNAVPSWSAFNSCSASHQCSWRRTQVGSATLLNEENGGDEEPGITEATPSTDRFGWLMLCRAFILPSQVGLHMPNWYDVVMNELGGFSAPYDHHVEG